MSLSVSLPAPRAGVAVAAPLAAAATLTAAPAHAIAIPGLTHEVAQECSALAPARIVERTDIDSRFTRLKVTTGIGTDTITLDVLHPADDAPRSTLYILPGMLGDPQRSWVERTDAREFFADKHVNVVFFRGAAGSMMSDWNTITRLDAPVRAAADALGLSAWGYGSGCWEQFAGVTLPQLIDAAFSGTGSTTGHDMVAGLSMSGAGALIIGANHPERFAALGSFSGFPLAQETSSEIITGSSTAVSLTAFDDLWGPPGSPDWVAHNPANRLADFKANGQRLYVGYGTGMPGPVDFAPGVTDTDRLGGILTEVLAADQGQRFARMLADAAVPVHHEALPYGLHDWGVFQHHLHASWENLFAGVAD